MACVTNLSLNPQTPDAHMDGAIYHPTRNSFFAVRQGYITEYSTALVILQGPTRFAASISGRSCIAYDSVNDRIWVGVNGDHAAGYLGDTGSGTTPSKTTALLYRIIPSSLAVEATIDPSTFLLTITATKVQPWGAQSGIYDVLVANGRLFATYAGIASTQYEQMTFSLTLPGSAASWWVTSSLSFNTQLAHDSSNQLWVLGDWDKFEDLFPLYGPDTGVGSLPNSVNVHPTNAAHCAIAFSSVGGGAIYVVEMTNTSLAKYNFTTGNLISEPAMAGASIGGMTSRLRFNSNDNLLYVPCPATNQVIAFNPSGDTVSHIYTTALDSPCDVVFAPGGVNVAVQQGSQGLVRLT